MRAVLQRVTQASVTVDGAIVGEIVGPGWLVLLGVGKDDTAEDVARMADKIVELRGFSDDQGKMNLSVRDVSGGVLLVSQFTIWGDCRAGRRPSFTAAAPPELAEALYQDVAERIRQAQITLALGVFRAQMEVRLVNDGPVTFMLDTRKLF